MEKFVVVIYKEDEEQTFDSLEEAEDFAEYQNRVNSNKTEIIVIEDD
jgi:hypothetical protein